MLAASVRRPLVMLNNTVSFRTRPGLILCASIGGGGIIPPKKSYGSSEYCFQATAIVYDASGKSIGKCTGFDKMVGIVEDVESACRFEVDRKYGPRSGHVCGDTRLVMLRSGKRCAGQIYFSLTDGDTRLIVSARRGES